jgi:hypothetical protein
MFSAWPVDATPMMASTPVSEDVIELPLLIPEWQLDCLEDAASERNMTVGQYVRRLFSDMFADHRPANY